MGMMQQRAHIMLRRTTPKQSDAPGPRKEGSGYARPSVLVLVFLASSFSWSALAARAQTTRLQQMKSGEVAARVEAIESAARGQQHADEVLAALRDLYLNDPQPQIRRAARIALGQLQTARPRIAATPASRLPFRFEAAAPEPAAEEDGPFVPDPLFRNRPFGGQLSPQKHQYVEPTKPTERVAKLMKQLKADPNASIAASEKLAQLGKEAEPASGALLDVMMRRQPQWADAQLAATKALEKIFPQLQYPCWALILENSTEATFVHGPLRSLDELGPRAYAALPLVMTYWNQPEAVGLRIESNVLTTMHIIAPKDPVVTREIVRVLKRETYAGFNTLAFAIEIADQRDLPEQQVFELLAALALGETPLGDDVKGLRGYAAQKLVEMARAKKMPVDPVVKLLIQLLERDMGDVGVIEQLGQFGPAAKDALPLLERIKYQHPERRVRGDATQAIHLINL